MPVRARGVGASEDQPFVLPQGPPHKIETDQIISSGDMEDQIKKGAGLCADCRSVKVARSGKGSTFFFCRRSETDSAYPKYPPLPVLSCKAYEPLVE